MQLTIPTTAVKTCSRYLYRFGGSTKHFRFQAFNSTRYTLNAYSSTKFKSHSTLHRPIINAISSAKNTPVTQSFRTSVPERASRDTSTIDYCFFPSLSDSSSSYYDQPCVPLLPDNYSPNRSLTSNLFTDSLNIALPKPEISIVASHPEHALPAAISETFSNDGLDFNLSGLIAPSTNNTSEIPEDSILKGLWHGIIEDFLVPKAKVGI